MRGLIIIAGALLFGGCAGTVIRDSKPASLPDTIELGNTPFFPQESYQCGPAALATVLDASGVEVTPAELVEKVYVPGRKGSYQTELISATRSYGRIPYIPEPELAAMMNEISAGHAVLIFQNLGYRLLPAWHYAVVIGYSVEDDALYLRSGTTKREVMSASRFANSWQRGDKWAMVALPPDVLPAGNDASRYLESVASAEAAGFLELAIAAYRAALTRWPDNTTAMFGLGNAYYRQGNTDGSMQMFRRIIELDAAHIAALNNLAALLLEQGQCGEARSTIRLAEQQSVADSAMHAAIVQTSVEAENCKPAPATDQAGPTQRDPRA